METKHPYLIIRDGVVTGFDAKACPDDVTVPAGVTEIGVGAFRDCSAKSIELPDGVLCLREGAFRHCVYLERVFIPASVHTAEKDLFTECRTYYGTGWGPAVYLESEPSEGWREENRTVTVREEVCTPEDDAFNFHRSSGGFTSHVVEREVTERTSWNGECCKVYPHTSRAAFRALRRELRAPEKSKSGNASAKKKK